MRKILLAVLIVIFVAVPVFAADITLPSPQKDGGSNVLAAIDARGSAAQTPFKSGALTAKELSTLLWAASGKNRGGKGWTAPYALGKAPYLDVYVLLKDGSYRYDWQNNVLRLASDKNIIGRAGSQAYVATAPCVLVFAVSGPIRVDSWAEIAAGAMSQNVYLAAQAQGLKTRYIQSFNKNAIIDAIQLSPVGRVICIMPVGRQ
jgi:nitroreductase